MPLPHAVAIHGHKDPLSFFKGTSIPIGVDEILSVTTTARQSTPWWRPGRRVHSNFASRHQELLDRGLEFAFAHLSGASLEDPTVGRDEDGRWHTEEPVGEGCLPGRVVARRVADACLSEQLQGRFLLVLVVDPEERHPGTETAVDPLEGGHLLSARHAP